MKNKKLQALIGAIKNIYTIIQSKLRLLTCWQQAVGKTDCVDDVSCDCKKNKLSCFDKISKMKILRKLGFKDFYKYDEIVSMLVEDDSQQVFTKRQYVLFMKTESERLWMIGSKTHIYFVFDTGSKYEILYKRPKNKNIKDGDFQISEGEKYAKFIFPDNIEIPYDIVFSGGTQTVIDSFKNFNND